MKSKTSSPKRTTIAKARKRIRRTTPIKTRGQSKLDVIVSALRSAKGATISDLMIATGWQMHSVRGVIAGTLKKKRGLKITSNKVEGERVYRIAGQS